jgi:hypothetical protein
MAQAVSRRPLTAEDRVRVRLSPCDIYGGHRCTGTGFSPTSSVFPLRCRFTVTINSYITWGMNNRPVGGRRSETSSRTIDMNNTTRHHAVTKSCGRVVSTHSCFISRNFFFDIFAQRLAILTEIFVVIISSSRKLRNHRLFNVLSSSSCNNYPTIRLYTI